MILILQSRKLKLREVIVTCPRSSGPDSTGTTECKTHRSKPLDTHTHHIHVDKVLEELIKRTSPPVDPQAGPEQLEAPYPSPILGR